MPSMWPNTLGRFVQSWLSAGGGVAVATITGNRVLDGNSAQVQQITASGGNRSVLLPPIANNGFGNGQVFWVQNAGSSNNVLVKDSTGATPVVTLTPGDWAMVVSYGSTTTPTWAVPVSSTGLTSLTLSGLLTSVGATITGPVQFKDPATPTKIAAFSMSGITGGQTRTLTVPDASGTIALTSSNISGSAGSVASTGYFLSAQQTGTGAPQNIAHGLGVTPNLVFVIPDDIGGGGVFSVTYGTATSTNAVVTFSNGQKYRVVAFK